MGGRCIYTPASLRSVLKSFAVAIVIALGGTVAAWNGDATAATVLLSPGDNIQNAVNTNPAGTTFVLQPGIYRGQSITSLQSGDTFSGEIGAVMDGAKVLNGWTQVSIGGSLYWTTAGGTPLPTPDNSCNSGPSSCCLPGYYPACTYVQDLYVNNIEYQHVTSLNQVAAGTWYYDFSGGDGGIVNNIYLAANSNPNFATVELGNQSQAFQSTASNITISNLTIEKYAAPIGSAAVQVEGPNWVIANSVIQLNHGEGITTKPGANAVQVTHNIVQYNGESGVGDPASFGQWTSNIFAYNDTDRVSTDYSGNGGKFTGSNITVSDNVSHDNVGSGLHADGGATNITFDRNVCYNNTSNGIRYEISRYGTITNNVLYYNGYGYGAQIVYTGSDHGTISGNFVIDNGYGAIDVTNAVGARPGAYTVTDTQVTNNTVWLSSTADDVAVDFEDRAQPPQPGIFSDPTNFFDGNTYDFSLGYSRNAWLWGETDNYFAPMSWANWQANQQDRHGTIRLDMSGPQL